MEKKTVYDKTELFREKILPLRDAFMKECALADIPTFVSSAVENTEKETTYLSDMVSAVTKDIVLSDDKIVKMANILNGFDVVETNKVLEITME